MKTRIGQNGYLELLLGIGLIVAQLCAWPTEQQRVRLLDDVPDVLEMQSDQTCQQKSSKALEDCRVNIQFRDASWLSSNPS